MVKSSRNAIVFVANCGILYLLWNGEILRFAPMVLLVLFTIVWGFGVYFAFDGTPALRVVLATVSPFIAGVAMELTAGDDGYRYLRLLIAGVFALLVFMGSVVGLIVLQWHRGRSPT